MARDRKEYFKAWHLKNRERRLEASRSRYLKNKTRITAANKAYRETHPEVARRAWRKYRQKNQESCRIRNREWYHRNIETQRKRSRDKARRLWQKDPEKVLEYNRLWARSHPEVINAKSQKRRAIKRGATLEDPKLIAQWMKEVRRKPFTRCYWCGTKVRGSRVHFDHVTPLNKGGSHSISNLCSSCPDCNLSKKDKAVVEWMYQGQTFLSL